MAKIHEEIIVIKVSKLIRDSEDGSTVATDEILQALQGVTEELVGTGAVVEVDTAK
jgi:hypothetical protein